MGEIQLCISGPIQGGSIMYDLNARGWCCLYISAANMSLSVYFALNGSYICLFSLFVSFIMWCGIYDIRNLKHE